MYLKGLSPFMAKKSAGMLPRIYCKENNVLARAADDLIGLQLCPYKEQVQKLQAIFQKHYSVNKAVRLNCKHFK